MFEPIRRMKNSHADCIPCRVSPFAFLYRFLNDLINHRGSVLLMVVFLPLAAITIAHAQLERFWLVGTIHCNMHRFVSDDDEDVMDLVLTQSGSALARKICNEDDPLTSVKLVKACIKQIKRTNLYVNAVVCARFEKAIEEAEIADAAVRSNTVPACGRHFWGVPVLVKECMEVVGMPYTAGMTGRIGVTGKENACALDNMIHQSGAIILATTNVSEGCMWHESFNTVYGRTNNPYDLGRTAGGSSGGCGAGVASCMCPMAVTSDVGGSTRIPSLYNGLFGHKPTGGAVSNTRTIPDVGLGGVRNYCQLGPMSKHAEDLWPLLNSLMTLEDDTASKMGCSTNMSLVRKAGKYDAPEEVDLSKLKVLHVDDSSLGNALLLSALHPDISSSIKKAVSCLKEEGCEILPSAAIKDHIPEMFSLLNAFSVWGAYMSKEKHEPFSETIREGLPPFGSFFAIVVEFMMSIFAMSIHTLPALLLGMAEFAVKLSPSETDRNCQLGAEIKKKLYKLLDEHTILIVPNLPTSAPMHNESIIRIFDTSNTCFFNAMELPATAVPCGLSANGLPIGFQIVAGHGCDHISIAVAMKLQRESIAQWCPPQPHAC